MGILECINILGDALRIHVVTHHLSGEIDEFPGMKPATVGVEVCKQVVGRDGGVV